jgi:hypothetical protein
LGQRGPPVRRAVRRLVSPHDRRGERLLEEGRVDGPVAPGHRGPPSHHIEDQNTVRAPATFLAGTVIIEPAGVSRNRVLLFAARQALPVGYGLRGFGEAVARRRATQRVGGKCGLAMPAAPSMAGGALGWEAPTEVAANPLSADAILSTNSPPASGQNQWWGTRVRRSNPL